MKFTGQEGLRTLAYLELEAYSEPHQRSMMKRFVKMVNSYNFLQKLQLLSQYQLFMFYPLWNQYYDFLNTGLIITSEVFVLM